MKYKLESFFKDNKRNSFRRINSTHPIDIFLGFDDKNQHTIIVKEVGSVKKIESSKYIIARAYLNERKKVTLSFSLIDKSLYPIFLKFCEDLIFSSEKLKKSDAINFIVARWNSWRKVFRRPNLELLSEKEIMGLLGELTFLKRYLIPKFGEFKAIEAWKGPEMASKDFQINETWYEIKTIIDGGLAITISSLEQLDSEVNGYLVLFLLEKSTNVANGSISLNSYIKEIEENIEDFDVKLNFRSKLAEVGYYEAEEYDDLNFNLKGDKFFLVDETFPRIKQNDLSSGIVKVSYKILINSIDRYLKVGVLNEN